MQLSISQIDIVVTVIEQRGIQKAAFKEELIDHYCCLVENYMTDGDSFATALKKCVADFESSDLLEIERLIVKQSKNKNVMLKNLSLLTLLILIVTTTFVFAQQDQIPDVRPLQEAYRISAGFGNHIHPIKKTQRHHDGIDIIAPVGTPVIATADGEVILSEDDGDKYGKHIKIKHNEEYTTFYAHLSELNVKQGQHIKQGDLIGKVGTTGLSTGPHLHYEVIKAGINIDPITIMIMDQ